MTKKQKKKKKGNTKHVLVKLGSYNSMIPLLSKQASRSD